MVKEIKVYTFDELDRELQVKVVKSNMDRIINVIDNYVNKDWKVMMSNFKDRDEFKFPWYAVCQYDGDEKIIGVSIEIELNDFPQWMFMSTKETYGYLMKILHSIKLNDENIILKRYKAMKDNLTKNTTLIVFIREFLMTCANEVTDWVLKMRYDTDYAVDYLLGKDDERFAKVSKFFYNRMFTEYGDTVQISENG